MSLPAISFAYDGMHLQSVSNGRGGSVRFTYDEVPWSADTYPKGTRSRPDAIPFSQTVWVNLYTHTDSEHPSTQQAGLGEFRPGAFYRLYCDIENGADQTIQFLFQNGVSQDVPPTVTAQTLPGVQHPRAETKILLSRYASKAEPYIYRTTSPAYATYARECLIYPLLTRYRVRSRTVEDDITDVSNTFTYDYTNPAGNTTTNSVALTHTPRLARENTEFRGHSKVSVTDPYGLRTETSFKQDDALAGRVTLVEQYRASDSVKLTEAITEYDVLDTTPTLNLSFCAHDSTNCYNDQRIYRTRVWWETQKNFGNGGTTYTGLKTEYTGWDAYNNNTLVEESYWNASSWVKYRMTQTSYSPNDPGGRFPTVYLVGLPGYQNIYTCPGGACSTDLANIIASSQTIYDGNAREYQAPTRGIVHKSRTFLYFVNGDINQLRYTDVAYTYDAWGNRTSVTQYSAESPYSGFGVGGARTTTMVYDTTYHARLIEQTSPYNLKTTWEYAAGTNGGWLGLPTKEIDSNG